jgi:hypothetical protein
MLGISSGSVQSILKKDKLPEKLNSEDWFLHPNTASAHTNLSVHEFLAKHEMTVLPNPSY